jgi:endonuclease VIII
MPEGPEVRKYADALDHVLTGRVINSLEARTRDAKEWLRTNEKRVVGQRVTRVVSHGKHLIGYLSGGFFFHSHLMMWGRWQTIGPVPKTKRSKSSEPFALPEKDRRERARIVVEGGAAILLSAPIFNAGKGDPYKKIENLKTLGPDVLPYNRVFDRAEFKRRLLLPQYHRLPIGAALLNQRIVAGLGNYLRAEVLFACKLDPWRSVADLSERDLDCLIRTVPKLAWRAYKQTAAAGKGDRAKMTNDATLVYQPGREYGTRHLVFRRTNLPCLRCGEKVKQLRQKTYNTEPAEEAEERTRIVYFCEKCQKVDVAQV